MAPVATDTTLQAPLNAVSETAENGPEVELGELLLEDLLVEEISIDGMCGVY